jgi:4-amino-4-deoxy-L-arabinose transferase-like glycosyltransferase
MRGLARPLALFVAVSVVTRAAFLGAGFLNVDEGAHLVGARELAEGGRLYVDFADNKPPLLHAYYALAQALVGPGLLGVRLFTAAVWLPLTALCAAAFDQGRRGRAAAVAFLVASAALLPSDAHAVNGEHVLLLPLAASALLLRDRRSAASPWRTLLAGLLVGVATLAKQPAALCGAAYAYTALRAPGASVPRRAVALATLALGFAIPLALTLAWFARQGTEDAFLFWVLRYNLTHVDNPMSLADRARRALEMGSVLIPSVGPLLYAYARGGHALGDAHRRRLVFGLVLTTFFPALLGWRLFGHYFVPLMFALALGAAPFFVARVHELEGRLVAGTLAVGLIVFTIVGRIVHDPARHVADVSDPRYRAIAAALEEPRCGGARPLFVWGYAPTIYAEAGLRPASRFVVPIDTITGYLAGNDAFDRGALDTHGRVVAEHWDLLTGDLERNQPEWIVDTAPASLNGWRRYPLSDFPRLDAFVGAHYRVDRIVGGATIYRSKDCPITARGADPSR